MTSIAKHAVLWDVDGTLSDSYLLGYTCTLKVLERNEQPSITEEQYHAGTKYPTPDRFAWHVTGNSQDKIGVDLGRQFDDMYVGLVSMETAGFFPGILNLLQELKFQLGDDLVLGALSNACGSYARAVLQANGVSSLFAVTYGADDVPAAKPKPDGLLACMSELNLHASQCIYIGDSPTDGQAAEAAGMRSVGVTWGSHTVDTVVPAFTHTAYSVEELKLYIEKLMRES